MPLITLFTAPKPFTEPHIDLIQRNALRSWLNLGEAVQVALIGGEAGIAEVAGEMGLPHFPQVGVNRLGTPLISSIFALGRSLNESPYLAYVNADIILFPEFTAVVQQVATKTGRFLCVGQRIDLEVSEPLAFTGDWVGSLRQRAHQAGHKHLRAGSDYFVYPRECFTTIPDFAVGRAGWDNWMIFHARRMNWPVVDCTPSLEIIHQNHDYAHLPDGKPHYSLPESFENIRLAGGRRTILSLNDATHQLAEGELQPMPRTAGRFLQELINYPLLKWNNYSLTQALFMLFHPGRASKEHARQKRMENTHSQTGSPKETA